MLRFSSSLTRAFHPRHPHRVRISDLLNLELGQVYQGDHVLPRLYARPQDSEGKRTGGSMVIHPRAPPPSRNGSDRHWTDPTGTSALPRASATRLDRHIGWLILHQAFIAAWVRGM